jgi:hypothetical protein
MSQIDFELWHKINERMKLAGIDWRGSERPDSSIVIQFSNQERSSLDWYFFTGNMNQYHKLIEGCQIRKSEMHIASRESLNFNIAWLMVHGENSTPPAE